MRKLSLTLCLLWATPLWAQKLEIPAAIPAAVGAWVVVEPTTDCKAVTYVGLDGLSSFPSGELKDPRKLVVNPTTPGKYRFTAVGSLNDVHVSTTFAIVVIDPNPTPVPPNPGPGPGPIPPNPGPSPGPGPTPPPIPAAGLRVMFVYETAALSTLPPGQVSVLYSKAVRDYLNLKCPVGADGKTKEYRFWDDNVDTSNESALWQAAFKRPRSSLPWVLISNGTAGFEGPTPGTIDEMMSLLRKYGG